MIEAVVSNSDLLKNQQLLPDELRQSCVLIMFSEPINATLVSELLCIRLTPLMHTKGEDSLYMVNRWQPNRIGGRLCPDCRQEMFQESINEFRCMNRRCAFSARRGLVAGPRVGIVDVKYPSDAVVRTDEKFEYIDKCVIVLDRRYDEMVLAGVLRTANQIAEERGWKIAG